MVPPGFRFPVLGVTNRPVEADRYTDLLFAVPDPTRSVVVFEGHRAAAALLTNRPELVWRWRAWALCCKIAACLRAATGPSEAAQHVTTGADMEPVRLVAALTVRAGRP